MNPLTVEEEPLGQWEVQIQTSTLLTFIEVKHFPLFLRIRTLKIFKILLLTIWSLSVPVWSGHPLLWVKLHREKQVHASPRGFSDLPGHISGVFSSSLHVLSSFV